MTRSLIILFSRADENYSVGFIKKGNTEQVADYVQEFTNADLFKVEPIVPYPTNYEECTKEAKNRLHNAPIKQTISDISDYDTIFIMTPVYWGSFAPEIETAVQNLDFNNKTIHVVTTHEGSGMGNVVKDLKLICKNTILSESNLAIYGHNAKNSRETVREWIEKLN